MFSWFLRDQRVTAMARVIDEMCRDAHKLRDTLNAPLHRYFTSHPMLTSHRAPAPAERDQVYLFRLSDGEQSFAVRVSDGQQDAGAWLTVSPDGDFAGVTVQSGRKGHYTVRIDRHSPRPQGRLAVSLVDEFVRTYDAVNTSG